MIVGGIDIGSRTTKAVLLNDHQILDWKIVDSGPNGSAAAELLLADILKEVGLARSELESLVATGYGRVNVKSANRYVTEISCHAKGANRLFPQVSTILDIGGQDAKAIRCDERGRVLSYVMNDKCAAGTGRYLERIGKVLGVSEDQIGPLSLQTVEGPLEISSFCAVFAQTDVMLMLRQGKHINDILAGACDAIITRIRSLLERVGGVRPDFVMTGGVAKNVGIVDRLSQAYKREVHISSEPQIVGALGAAIFAQEGLLKNSFAAPGGERAR